MLYSLLQGESEVRRYHATLIATHISTRHQMLQEVRGRPELSPPTYFHSVAIQTSAPQQVSSGRGELSSSSLSLLAWSMPPLSPHTRWDACSPVHACSATAARESWGSQQSQITHGRASTPSCGRRLWSLTNPYSCTWHSWNVTESHQSSYRLMVMLVAVSFSGHVVLLPGNETMLADNNMYVVQTAVIKIFSYHNIICNICIYMYI